MAPALSTAHVCAQAEDACAASLQTDRRSASLSPGPSACVCAWRADSHGNAPLPPQMRRAALAAPVRRSAVQFSVNAVVFELYHDSYQSARKETDSRGDGATFIRFISDRKSHRRAPCRRDPDIPW
jgi:hypothetical protein